MDRTIRGAGLVTVLFALTACAATGSLPPNAVVVTPLTLEPPPIYSLLGYRSELNLTSEQVAALDSIAQAVRDENRELVAELRQTSGERRGQSGAMVVSEEGRPVLESIRENQLAAVDAVSRLLDESQRAEVCRLSTRENQRRGAAQGRQPRQQEQLDPVDERSALQRPVGWNWCDTPVPDADGVI